MDDRFSLRFESTERRGEVVRIPSSGLTVGRKPGSTLQLLDNSVSGKHAELRVDGDGVRLVDLGSTNGTRVGGERVSEARLVDGCSVVFGNVAFVFRDLESDGPALEGELDVAPAGASTAAAGDGLERVDASLVARSVQRSPAGLVGVGVLVVAAAGLGAWLLLRPGGGRADTLAAVVPVPGNLLAEGYSFEGDRDPFSAHEAAPAAFLPEVGARHSGGQGLRADLAAGEWAEHRSPAFAVRAEREVRAQAALRARGAAFGRLGVEFSVAEDADEPRGPITAWCEPVEAGAGFVMAALAASVPPGYAQARVVLRARAPTDEGGAVDADDVSAVEAPAPRRPAAELAGAALDLHGVPPLSASLARIDRVLVSGIQLTTGAGVGPEDAVPLVARVEGPHIVLSAAPGAPRAARLVLRLEGALAAGGLATTAADGYRTAGAAPEREGVETLLLGRGVNLVRVVLPGPGLVRGGREGAAIVLSAELGNHEPLVRFHLDFSADKGAAEDLAHRARGAGGRGELGAAIAAWSELLDRFPYEAALVEEAEATRAKLVQQGLSEVRDLRAEAERARFFALPGLFSAARQRALAVAARFAGSEVEAEAGRLAAALETEVSALRRDEDRAERERLAAVLTVLEARGATGLAAEVRARLTLLEGPR